MKMDDFFWGEDPRFKDTPIYIYIMNIQINEHIFLRCFLNYMFLFLKII